MRERQKNAVAALFDELVRDIENGSWKRELMDKVAAEGREWSDSDEDQWRGALSCLGYPPDMPQPMPGHSRQGTSAG
jgi:hypothetical protein